MENNHHHKAPVALFLYRKHEFLQSLLEAIITYAPPKLYIVQDNSPNEEVKRDIARVQAIVRNTAFPFEVELLIHETHQGLRKNFHHSLDGIFAQEERLIVLEDDTIPSQSFFRFANAMLDRHEHDHTVGCINGCNLGMANLPNAYFRTGVSLPYWGWATWRRAWANYRSDGYYWQEQKETILNGIKHGQDFFMEKFTAYATGLNSWDVQWSWSLLANGQQTIMPGINLVSNKGFVPTGTFTNYTRSEFNALPVHDLADASLYKLESDEWQAKYEAQVIVLLQEISGNRIRPVL